MLQNKRYLIGDEAYPASHVMIVPWLGWYTLGRIQRTALVSAHSSRERVRHTVQEVLKAFRYALATPPRLCEQEDGRHTARTTQHQ